MIIPPSAAEYGADKIGGLTEEEFVTQYILNRVSAIAGAITLGTGKGLKDEAQEVWDSLEDSYAPEEEEE